MLPEVIFLAELYYMRRIHAYLVYPYIFSFVILFVYGHPKLVLGYLHDLGEELPSPRGGLALEIVTE